MLHKKVPLILFLSIISFQLMSQSHSYKNFKYEWTSVKAEPIEVEAIYKNQDAVILSDELVYNASGNKEPIYNIYYGLGNYYVLGNSSESKNPVVQRFVRIKYLTNDGIKKGNKFSLPESFDPIHEKLLCSSLDTLHHINLPVGEFECIRYIAGRIVKANGTIVPATISENIETIYRNSGTAKSTFYKWNFVIENLEPGDELQLDYSYEGSYTLQPSNKIYFNSIFPKENFKLTFREAYASNKMIICHNGAEISKTLTNKNSATKSRDYIFLAKNIKGGIDEVGARPVVDQPYISFYDHHMEFVKENTNSVPNTPLAYPWFIFLAKNLNYQMDNLKIHLLKQDKTTLAINHYFNGIKEVNPNSNLPLLMSMIHHDINENFKYQDDVNYFDGLDNRLERLGQHVEEKKLRYMSRLRFYSELFLRLDTSYYLGFIGDKRTDLIDIEKFEPISLQSEYFAVPFANTYIYYYPKGNRFGYETNEFPFYHEGATIELADQHLPVRYKTDVIPNITYPVAITPSSTSTDNSRKTSGMATISISNSKMNYAGKTILKGQYSTLIRGYYLFGSRDTTVNPKYFEAFNGLKPLTKDSSIIKNNVSTSYPFEASFNVKFIEDNFLTKEPSGSFSFNLEGWFNEITENNFVAKNRQLDYYPDFKSQDTHKFYLKFDEPIQLDSSSMASDTIKNSFGYYLINVEQKDANSMMVSSEFVVSAEKVSAENAIDVENIFNAINTLNKKKYKFNLASK